MSGRLPRNFASGLGLLLGLIGVVTYFAVVTPFLSPYWPALRDQPLLNLGLVGVALVVSALGVWRAVGRRPSHRGRVLAPLLGGLNLALAGFFVWYLADLSGQLPAAAGAPAVGAPAPAFSLTDQRGRPVALAALRGKPLVLLFYRGFW